ncbi:MAG: pyridoxal 5'-phosphate synthase glutaminase subunit PdxT [Chloroflexi bacterium]|nr:pyridoxal 5'-phosphate synthase glutaminase subunit PdxT [Chloroflexota bacterium]
MTRVGVLALQGDFREHARSLRAVGAEAREVRTPQELQSIDALIIPGGESTTIARLLLAYDLFEPIRTLGANGFPLWGTCAGAVLLADEVQGDLDREPLALMPMTIDRNAYGRQIDSFEAELGASTLNGSQAPFPGIFIRAPRIREVREDVEVLIEHTTELGESEPVAVRRGPLLATTFHPELTSDHRLHAYFVESCVQGNSVGSRAERVQP